MRQFIGQSHSIIAFASGNVSGTQDNFRPFFHAHQPENASDHMQNNRQNSKNNYREQCVGCED